MDIRKKKIINKLNKIGKYNIDDNTLIIDNLSAIIDEDNIINFPIEMSKYKDVIDDDFTIIFDACLFDFKNNLDNHYINLRQTARKIIFNNCNFQNGSYMVFLKNVSFNNCVFCSDIFVNGLDINFDSCIFSGTSFLNAMAEQIFFYDDNFLPGTSVRITSIPDIVINSCIFDLKSIILEDIRNTKIVDSKIITDIFNTDSLKSFTFINSDILSCKSNMDNSNMCLKNSTINSNDFYLNGSILEFENSNICGHELCIDNDTITKICSSIITGENICFKSPYFIIDKLSKICSESAYLEVDDKSNKKIDSINLEAKNVIINDSIITSENGEYVDISIIEPRNDFVNVLKKIRDNCNEKIDILSREYENGIKTNMTISNMNNIKVLKKHK